MYKIIRYGTVTSTNDLARELAESGSGEGTVVVASAQTNGRGRYGREFFSPKDTGLYMSVLLRPTLCAVDSLKITTAAALAVAEAIESGTEKTARIKWVNDVFVDSKKVAGILAEGKFNQSGGFEYVILGIGVNLSVPTHGFGALSEIAGAVFDGECDTEAFAREILDRFFTFYADLAASPHYEGYARRDMLCGREVCVMREGELLYKAVADGIEKDFSLSVLHGGKKESLFFGEVSVKL